MFYHLHKHSAWSYKLLLRLLKFTPILILEKTEIKVVILLLSKNNCLSKRNHPSEKISLRVTIKLPSCRGMFLFLRQKPASTTWFLQSNGERICLEMPWQARLKFRSFTTHFYWVIPLLSPWHFAPMLSQLSSVLSSVFTWANPGELATSYSPWHRQRRAADPRRCEFTVPPAASWEKRKVWFLSPLWGSCLCCEGHQSRGTERTQEDSSPRGQHCLATPCLAVLSLLPKLQLTLGPWSENQPPSPGAQDQHRIRPRGSTAAADVPVKSNPALSLGHVHTSRVPVRNLPF